MSWSWCDQWCHWCPGNLGVTWATNAPWPGAKARRPLLGAISLADFDGNLKAPTGSFFLRKIMAQQIWFWRFGWVFFSQTPHRNHQENLPTKKTDEKSWTKSCNPQKNDEDLPVSTSTKSPGFRPSTWYFYSAWPLESLMPKTTVNPIDRSKIWGITGKAFGNLFFYTLGFGTRLNPQERRLNVIIKTISTFVSGIQ